MGAMINVQNLDFSYGSGELKNQVLKKISLTINAGEIVIMTGPSGSGKTTLLTIIGGLRQAEIGSVSVLDKQLVSSIERTKVQIRQQIGYIFQQHNLLKSLTAVQNVSMALEMHRGLNEGERIERSIEMLSSVGLANRLHHKPDQLSGGQRRPAGRRAWGDAGHQRAQAGRPHLERHHR